jgi:protein-S-isoprenylcysteine O-methyltransferase Ste14
VFAAAFLLLFNDTLRFGPLAWRFVPGSSVVDYVGLFLAVVGVAFAIWARLVLGRNGSGAVTIKRNHTLIRTGPYAVVRHPIYAGFSLAIFGTAIAIGEIPGLVASGVAMTGMKSKSRLEEAFMMDQFGEAYVQSRKDVRAAMIPFVC